VFLDVTTWFVVFVRFSAYLLLFPITATQSIPVPLRLGFSAFCAFLILPLVPAVPRRCAR
jgi:flagellar biosynthesis protein FliR